MSENTTPHIPCVYEALTRVQNRLVSPKKEAKQGLNYKYKTLTDLREKLKPILSDEKCACWPTKRIENGFMVCTIHFVCYKDGSEITTEIPVQHDMHRGMSPEQSSGCASTYAEKYGMMSLFLVDDDSDKIDPDSPEAKNKRTNDLLAEISHANTDAEIDACLSRATAEFVDPQVGDIPPIFYTTADARRSALARMAQEAVNKLADIQKALDACTTLEEVNNTMKKYPDMYSNADFKSKVLAARQRVSTTATA